MEAAILSPSFIRLVRVITGKTETRKFCNGCCLKKDNLVSSPLGDVCPECKKELDTYIKDEKSAWSRFFSSNVEPQSSPSAKGWIHKFIEETNGVTLSKLQIRMQERDYSSSQIMRQLDLIKKQYEFDGENIIGLKPDVKIRMEDHMATKKKVAKKAGKGRVNTLKDKTFVATKKENPYRAESARGKAYEKLLKAGASGLAYSKDIEEGNCLRDGLHKGFIKAKA